MNMAASVRVWRDFMNCSGRREKLLLGLSIFLDVFLYVCFFGGMAILRGGSDMGGYMLSVAFLGGAFIGGLSALLKLAVIVSGFRKGRERNQKLLIIAASSLACLSVIGAFMGGIYYIGKVMSTVG